MQLYPGVLLDFRYVRVESKIPKTHENIALEYRIRVYKVATIYIYFGMRLDLKYRIGFNHNCSERALILNLVEDENFL